MSEKVCFTVTIESSLISQWVTPVTLDEEGNPFQQLETQTVEGAVEPQRERKLLLTDPYFRYSFLSEKRRVKETTPQLTVDGTGGWSEIKLSEEEEAERRVRAGIAPLKEEKAANTDEIEEAENASNDDAEPALESDPEASIISFEKKHNVAFSEEDLLAFNDFPFISFTLADALEGEDASAVFPPKPKTEKPQAEDEGEDDRVDSTEEEQGPPRKGRNFIDTKVFDLSGFLVGETEKSWTWGDKLLTSEDCLRGAGGDSDADQNHRQQEGGTQDLNLTQFNGSSLEDENEGNKNNGCNNDSNSLSLQSTSRNPPPPPGLRYLKITVTADKPLLNAKLTDKYNPVSVTIRNAKDLPGVRVTSLADKHYVQPTRFKLLEQYCNPCYCIVRMFAGDREICPRVVRTDDCRHNDKCEWNHTTAYLTGHMDRQLLEEAVENLPFTVELQDREPVKKKSELAKILEHYERMLVGGFPLENGEGGVTLPMDVFEVDEIRLFDIHEGWKKAGEDCSHGISTCGMKALLDQSNQLSAAFKKNYATGIAVKAPNIKERLSVVQEKRRRIPKGGLDEWDLNEGERLVRKTGNYLADGEMDIWAGITRTRSSSTIGISCSLARPLRTLEEGDSQRTGPPDPVIYRPFTRAVYTFEYHAVKQLQTLNRAIDRVNETTLRETMIGSLMSYQFSEEEVERANNAELNVICGFMVIDDDCRMVFVEGTVEGMESVLNECKRHHRNDWSCRVLSNPDVRFKERIYTDFNVDLKKIRLREPLPMLNEMPEIYNRAKVSQDCFEALHRLGLIRHANRLEEASHLQMFPTASMIIQVESKYGESISMEDILGVKPKKKIRSWEVKEEIIVEEEEEVVEEKKIDKLKADTDARNPEFDEHLRTRKTKDFLGLQDELLTEAKKEGERRLEARKAADALEDPVRFMYSSQRLAYTEIKKEKMRQRLSKAKNCTFTYSQQFTSQTVSMVDAERLKQVEEEESRSRWKTKKGFVYPAPRKATEYAVHPQKPSQSRIEILTEEWIENELHPENVKREVKLKDGQPDFNTVPSNGKMIFGGLEAPKFTREFASENIGSSTKLPRGKIINETNPEFFNSVHLCGEGLFVEEQEEKRKAEEEWKSKVCVDSLDFLVGGFVQQDKTDPVDRVKDILDGPALKKSLKIVRNAKLPSGKKIPLRPAPFSMFNDKFEDPKDFTVDLRPNDATTYLAKNKSTGLGEDFMRYIHNDSGKPRSQTFVAKKKAKPLDYSSGEIKNDPRFSTGGVMG